jgi:hypothetical protein
VESQVECLRGRNGHDVAESAHGRLRFIGF